MLEFFMRWAIYIALLFCLIAFGLFFVRVRIKRIEKLPEYLSHTVGLILAFFNLAFLVVISKMLWFEDHHRWVTQIRIENYKELADNLRLTESTLNQDSTKVLKIREFLEDRDLNHYFFLNDLKLRILDSLQRKINIDVCNLAKAVETNHKESVSNQQTKSSFINYKITRDTLLAYLNRIIMKEEIDDFKHLESKTSHLII